LLFLKLVHLILLVVVVIVLGHNFMPIKILPTVFINVVGTFPMTSILIIYDFLLLTFVSLLIVVLFHVGVVSVASALLLGRGCNFVYLLFQDQRDRSAEEFKRVVIFISAFTTSLEKLLDHLIGWESIFLRNQSGKRLFKRFKVDVTLTHTFGFERHTQLLIFVLSPHLFDRDVLNTELGAFLLGSFHGAFEDTSGVDQFELVDWRQNVLVLEVGIFRSLLRIVIFYFGVHTILGLIVYPLTNKEFILIVVEVGALTFC